MAPVDVVRTYLQLAAMSELRGAETPRGATVEPISERPWESASRLYREVGSSYHWRDRLTWSEQQWRVYLSNPCVMTFVAFQDRVEVGYFELVTHDDSSVEITYFGLKASAQGRGLGKWLLVSAAERAFAMGATRVWLHTCTLDSPAALPNYLARGFSPYKTERYVVESEIST